MNESSERMGQSSLPRSLGSRDCARDCGRELASESFLRSHLSSASFSSLESRYQTRQPALRPEQSRARAFSLSARAWAAAAWRVAFFFAFDGFSSYRLHGCPLHCRSSAHAGQQGALTCSSGHLPPKRHLRLSQHARSGMMSSSALVGHSLIAHAWPGPRCVNLEIGSALPLGGEEGSSYA